MRMCVVILVALVAAVASGVARFCFANPAMRVWLDALFLFSTAVAVVGVVSLIATFGGGRLMHHFHVHDQADREDHRDVPQDASRR